MPVNVKRMRKVYDENQRGGDMWTPPPGSTLLYIHDRCRPSDDDKLTEGLNTIPVVVHYGLGKDRQMSVCLDPERNPIIAHPVIREYLKKRKVKIGKRCPVCLGIQDGTMSADSADDASPTTRFMWGLTPVFFKTKPSAPDWQSLPPKAQVALVGSTLYNGIMELFFELGDITDLGSAVFVQIDREGKGRFDTKYTVKACLDKSLAGSASKPAKMSKQFSSMINKAVSPDGDCDLFRIIANMVKSTEDVTALISSSSVPIGEGDDDDDDDYSSIDEEVTDESDELPEDVEEDAVEEDAVEEDAVEEDDVEEDAVEEDAVGDLDDLGIDDLDAELARLSEMRNKKKASATVPAKKRVKKA